VYCDKMAKDRIMLFYYNVEQCPISLPAQFDDEIRRGSAQSGAQTIGWAGFDFVMHAIARKRCEIELR